MEPNIIELLLWDTDFFGFPVAQITRDHLDRENMQAAHDFCRENQVRLLQFKCAAHHRESVLLAEENNFHFADVRMTYKQNIEKEFFAEELLSKELSFRLGDKDDIPMLKEIITDLYTHSRYYFDSRFPHDRVKIFYRDWMEKAVLGLYDDFAWVVCLEEQPVGFCTVSIDATERTAVLGLVGVDKQLAGQGVGGKLMQEILKTLKKKNVKDISVITQGRNYAAQRLYQRNGFLIDKIEIYYHCWFSL